MYINDTLEVQNKIKAIAQIIKGANHVMVLTGAGMSTDSGIPAFRTVDGLYLKYPEDVLSVRYSKQKTDLFYEAFMKKFSSILKAKPNERYQILVKWQQLGYVKSIAAQNIDNLHHQAVEQLTIPDERKNFLKKQIYEIHGTIRTFTVKTKKRIYKLKLEDILNENGIIEYKRQFDGDENTYIAKPDVVLFGENVKRFPKVAKIIMEKVDVILILGTSLTVTPFSLLPTYMKPTGKIIIVNDVSVDNNVAYGVSLSFDYYLWGKITPVLKAIDEEIQILSK